MVNFEIIIIGDRLTSALCERKIAAGLNILNEKQKNETYLWQPQREAVVVFPLFQIDQNEYVRLVG